MPEQNHRDSIEPPRDRFALGIAVVIDISNTHASPVIIQNGSERCSTAQSEV